MYPFRPDWNTSKEAQLSEQQRDLLLAENAVLECRFTDAYPLLQSILSAPDDICIEISCLWNVGICCIALNKPDDFYKIFLRLQLLLSEDFPHRDDLTITLDILKTYVETISSAASNDDCNTDIHDQCLPLLYLKLGYENLTKEAMTPGSADTTLLKLGLRYLKTNNVTIAIEMLHCHLLGIYYLRQNMTAAENHAREVVRIAFENKLYFPLVTYFRYFIPALSPILEQYPEDFQNHCQKLISEYEKNFTAFLSSLNRYSVVSKLTNEDYPYIYAVLMDLSVNHIMDKFKVSKSTVNRRLAKIYKIFNVQNKKELKDYLHNYM